MEKKVNIVTISLDEYNRLCTDIRTLSSRNEKLREQIDYYKKKVSELDDVKMRNAALTDICLSLQKYQPKQPLKAKKKDFFTRVRAFIQKTIGKTK